MYHKEILIAEIDNIIEYINFGTPYYAKPLSDETVEAVAGGCGVYETERISIMDIIQLNKRLMTPGVLESLVKIKIPDDDDV